MFTELLSTGLMQLMQRQLRRDGDKFEWRAELIEGGNQTAINPTSSLRHRRT